MLKNTYVFVKTIIDWKAMEKAFGGSFLVTYVDDYSDKKNKLPDGYKLTLMVQSDSYNYGLDKNEKPRQSNLYNTFEVTILSRDVNIKKGDIVKLLNFRNDVSYVLEYGNLLLRFDGVEVLGENKND